MARPRRVSDAQILAAAAEAFIKHGPQVSIKVIADSVGISQPAIFKRFGTKEKLLIEALDPPGPPEWAEWVEQGPQSEDFRAELSTLLRHLSAFIQEMEPRMNALRASGISLKQLLERHEVPPPVQAKRSIARWFELADARGLARIGCPAHYAMLCLSVMKGLAANGDFSGQLLEETTLDDYLSFLVDLVSNRTTSV